MAVHYGHAPFNAAAVLQLTGPFDAGALERTISILHDRHPVLGAGIIDQKFIEFVAAPPVPLRQEPRIAPDAWRPITETLLTERLPEATGPLLAATALVGDGDDWDLIVLLHHAVVDGPSVGRLVHELLTVYAAVVEDRPMPDAPPVAPPPAVDDLMPLTGARLAARKAWLLAKSQAGEVRYRLAMRRHGVFRVQPDYRIQIDPTEFDAKATTALSRAARRRRLTVHSVLQAAMLQSVHRAFYPDAALPLRTMAFVDLRPHLERPAPDTAASYMAMTWHDVPLEPGADLASVAAAVQAQVSAAVRNGGKFVYSAATAPLLKMTTAVKRFRMGNTALAYTNTAPVDESYGPLRVRDLRGFNSNMGLGPEYAMRAGVFAGRLCMDAVTLDADMTREQGRDLGAGMVALLREFAGS